MSKPMELSGNKNAIAQDYYIFMGVLGCIFLFFAPLKYIVNTSAEFGEPLARIWAALLIVGAVSSLLSMRHEDAEKFLKEESGSSLVIGSMMLIVLIAVAAFGALSPFGGLLMAFFASAGLHRSWQTFSELKKVRAARAIPSMSLGAYLSEPDKQTHNNDN